MKSWFKIVGAMAVASIAVACLAAATIEDNTALKSVTYTWDSGAFAGGQYKLVMSEDSLYWEGLEGAEKGKSATEESVVYVDLGDGRQMITWLEGDGYTVTVIVNTKSGRVDGVVSNEKEHYVLGGKVDEMSE